MTLSTMDPLVDWLEEFRSLNLSSESESDTARDRDEHEVPAQENPSVPSQEPISLRKILPVFSVAKLTKRDGRLHSMTSSNFNSHPTTKPKSPGQQGQAMSALSDRGYIKLASKRYQNFSLRKNKRKFSPEDDKCKGARAMPIFNPTFNAALMHNDYENARRMEQSKKLYHIKRTTHLTPVSKTPCGTRVNRVFPRGLDLSYKQLVVSIGHRSVDSKKPAGIAWPPWYGMSYLRWDLASVEWEHPLRTFERSRINNSVSKQMVIEGPRVTATMLIAETLDDLEVLFAPFQLLPTELRLRVWNLARPEPRIVRLLKSKYYPAVYSKTPIPGMLHACRESHDVALQWYKLMFSRELDDDEIINQRFLYPRTYFDLENDVLYAGCEACYALECSECKPLLSDFDAYDIQKVLFHWETPTRPREENPYYELSNFAENLKEVMILGPGTKALRAGTGFDQLVKSITQFQWQEKPTLLEDCVENFLRWEYATVEVMTRVEIVE